MVIFRRSLKGQKSVAKFNDIIVQQNEASAVQPPKKIIRALQDCSTSINRPDTCLSFSAGDFLHVTGRENDKDWYEACNPLLGRCGLVPVSFFEDIERHGGRTSKKYSHAPSNTHKSFGFETNDGTSTSPNSMPKNNSRYSKVSRTGAMVYGVVMYDFTAERPDELEAKEGEAIIVIAQSNPEWFVAKPITRLGGPGLIPASFIEIRDMATGIAVLSTQEALSRAGVPKVEEWKKMAAEYKNGSIPLGQLNSDQNQSLYRSEEVNNTGNFIDYYKDSTINLMPDMESSGLNSDVKVDDLQSKSPVAVEATVPRYCYADDKFWFIINVVMDNGQSWELSRYYKDFYDLQISLIKEYPLEAGNVKGFERSLPYMPGPVTYVTENITNGRRANLDEYLKHLIRLSENIRTGSLLKSFFTPREGDNFLGSVAGVSYSLLNESNLSPNEMDCKGSDNEKLENIKSSSGIQMLTADTESFSHRNSSKERLIQTQTDNENLSGPGHTRFIEQNIPHMINMPTQIKVKCWLSSKNCVILRLNERFSYGELRKKVIDRLVITLSLGSDVNDAEIVSIDDSRLEILYKNSSKTQFERLESDLDLKTALNQEDKLILWIRFRDSD